MTGKELLDEIDRREYYRERERKNEELVKCVCYAIVMGIIICGLLSIAGNVHKLWDALATCF